MIITNALTNDECGDLAECIVPIPESTLATILDKITLIEDAAIAYKVIEEAPFIPIADYPFLVFEGVEDWKDLTIKLKDGNLLRVKAELLLNISDTHFFYYIEDDYLNNLCEDHLDEVSIHYGYVETGWNNTEHVWSFYWRLFVQHCSTMLTTPVLTTNQAAFMLDAVQSKA